MRVYKLPTPHMIVTWPKPGGGYGGSCDCGEVHASDAIEARRLAEKYCRQREEGK